MSSLVGDKSTSQNTTGGAMNTGGARENTLRLVIRLAKGSELSDCKPVCDAKVTKCVHRKMTERIDCFAPIANITPAL